MAVQASTPLTAATPVLVDGSTFIHASFGNGRRYVNLEKPDGAIAFTTGFFDQELA